MKIYEAVINRALRVHAQAILITTHIEPPNPAALLVALSGQTKNHRMLLNWQKYVTYFRLKKGWTSIAINY